MRAMDFEEIETGLGRPQRRLAPLGHQLTHLARRQGARRCRLRAEGHGAGRHQLPAIPVVNFGLAARQRRAAFPWTPQARLAAGMAELNAGNGTVCLDELCASRQRRDELVVPQTDIITVPQPLRAILVDSMITSPAPPWA